MLKIYKRIVDICFLLTPAITAFSRGLRSADKERTWTLMTSRHCSSLLHSARIVAPQCPRFRHLTTGPVPTGPGSAQSVPARPRPTRTRPDRVEPKRSPATLPDDTSAGDIPPGRPESTCGNSGTTEAATVLVVPLFPRTPRIRGHNSQEHGTGPGIREGSSTGISEVIFSNVWMAEVRAGGVEHVRIFPGA